MAQLYSGILYISENEGTRAIAAAAAAKSLQSCPTLCDPIDLDLGVASLRSRGEAGTG